MASICIPNGAHTYHCWAHVSNIVKNSDWVQVWAIPNLARLFECSLILLVYLVECHFNIQLHKNLDDFLTPEIILYATIMNIFVFIYTRSFLTSQNLLIFAHVLGGTTDGVLFRYQLLLADLIDLLPWRSTEEFTKWATLVYPFLQVCTQCYNLIDRLYINNEILQ